MDPEDSATAVRDALVKGLGIGQLPLPIAREALSQRRLARVLPDWHPVPVPVHAVYPSHRYLAPKVRAFVDVALERFAVANPDTRRIKA